MHDHGLDSWNDRLLQLETILYHVNELIPLWHTPNFAGTRTLAGILSEREVIANGMQSTLDEATDPWGVVVERVEV